MGQDINMKRIYFLLLIVLTVSAIALLQQSGPTIKGASFLPNGDHACALVEGTMPYFINKGAISKLEIPKLKPNEYVITHSGYSLSYNELNEQANWVAYELTDEETHAKVKRANKFVVDPLVKTGTANDKDYAGSGFDKGHLAPAGDMGWSAQTMTESFYYSNMSPQDLGFNRGIWKRTEELVRSWAIEYKSVYVVTGPVLTGGLQSIGSDKVSVPKYFYKVILDYNPPDIKGIGFVIPNTGSKGALQSYAVCIDEVEAVTGIDFFPLLPDDQESVIEGNIDTNAWIWKSSATNVKINKSNGTRRNSTMVQCSGKTRKGTRCKNRTNNISGRCYLHLED